MTIRAETIDAETIGTNKIVTKKWTDPKKVVDSFRDAASLATAIRESIDRQTR